MFVLVVALLLWRFSASLAGLSSRQVSLKAEPIRIAVANAFSGPNAPSGIAMLRGAQLLADKINAEGGIHGHPLVLQPFDDRRNAEQAEKVAEQIAMQQYLAGFGQWVTVIQGVIFVACVLAFRRGIVGEIAHRFGKSL